MRLRHHRLVCSRGDAARFLSLATNDSLSSYSQCSHRVCCSCLLYVNLQCSMFYTVVDDVQCTLYCSQDRCHRSQGRGVCGCVGVRIIVHTVFVASPLHTQTLNTHYTHNTRAHEHTRTQTLARNTHNHIHTTHTHTRAHKQSPRYAQQKSEAQVLQEKVNKLRLGLKALIQQLLYSISRLRSELIQVGCDS